MNKIYSALSTISFALGWLSCLVAVISGVILQGLWAALEQFIAAPPAFEPLVFFGGVAFACIGFASILFSCACWFKGLSND